MSSALGRTLSRAMEQARAQGYLEVTLEHMLVSLCEDPDAALVLAASNVDVNRLKSDAGGYLAGLQRQGGHGPDPVVSADLRRIMEAAAAAARGGRRREINGAIVLAAIVGDGKSPAAQMLQSQGLTFEGAIRALQRGAGVAARQAPPSTEDILASARQRVQSRTGGSMRKLEAEPAAAEVEAEPEPAEQEEGVDYDDVPPTAPAARREHCRAGAARGAGGSARGYGRARVAGERAARGYGCARAQTPTRCFARCWRIIFAAPPAPTGCAAPPRPAATRTRDRRRAAADPRFRGAGILGAASVARAGGSRAI